MLNSYESRLPPPVRFSSVLSAYLYSFHLLFCTLMETGEAFAVTRSNETVYVAPVRMLTPVFMNIPPRHAASPAEVMLSVALLPSSVTAVPSVPSNLP